MVPSRRVGGGEPRAVEVIGAREMPRIRSPTLQARRGQQPGHVVSHAADRGERGQVGSALGSAFAGRGATDGRQRQGDQDQDQAGTEQRRQGLPAPAVGEMRRSAGRPAQSQQTPRDSASRRRMSAVRPGARQSPTCRQRAGSSCGDADREAPSLEFAYRESGDRAFLRERGQQATAGDLKFTRVERGDPERSRNVDDRQLRLAG